jgi:hypothetical protein
VRVCNEDDDHPGGMEREDDETYYTGGQIESIIRMAFDLASGEPLSFDHLMEALNDYIPPRDMITQGTLTRLAMAYTNRKKFIPKDGVWHRMARNLGMISNKDKSNKLPRKTKIEFD